MQPNTAVPFQISLCSHSSHTLKHTPRCTHTHSMSPCVCPECEMYLLVFFHSLECVTRCSCIWISFFAFKYGAVRVCVCVPVVAGLSPSIVFGRYEWAGLVFGSLEALSLAQQQPYLSLTLMAIFCICHNRCVFVCLWGENVSGKSNERKCCIVFSPFARSFVYCAHLCGCMCVCFCIGLCMFVCVCVCVYTLEPSSKRGVESGEITSFFPFLSLWKMTLCLQHIVHTHTHTHTHTHKSTHTHTLQQSPQPHQKIH